MQLFSILYNNKMKRNYKKNLAKKGWSEAEIKRVEKSLETGFKHEVYFSRILFYSALMLVVFANLLISLAIMFLAIVLNSLALYSIIVITAAMVGFLYNFLITDIGHLEKKHHVFASILLPLVGLFNLALIVIVSNKLVTDLGLGIEHNPWVVGFVFIVAFILPSVVDKLFFQE